MDAVIRKWGNSAALRLPTAVMREASFTLEQTVRLRVSRGRIVIEPIERIAYDLDQLVAGITAGNAHESVDFGPPVGKETL